MMNRGEKTIEESIRDLCQEEDFAVLATQGNNQPYTSLVGFVTTADLKYVAFATPKQTRKYFLLESNKRVAFMVDNRDRQLGSINDISAVTITGNAKFLKEKEESEHWCKLLIDKHPYLDDFVKSSATALVVVEVDRCFYVRKFQEVTEWIPQ
jgi:nitroimidazol reductase NimA-like FMN-containing flavoprotein (pyridoxamine 5'-phosphate oxidase superfamily)